MLLSLRLIPALAAPPPRDWTTPGTRPGTLELTPATDDATVTVRRVGMRSRDGHIDTRGEVTVYPVVLAPNGARYLGFERTYAAGAVGRRWLYWDFPTQFRAPDARVRTEAEADLGDHLIDVIVLGTAQPEKTFPAGVYELKWVVSGELIDNGDTFKYTYRASQTDR